MATETRPLAIVVGSGGAIARSLLNLWTQSDRYDVIAIGRAHCEIENVQSLLTDYSETSLAEVAASVATRGTNIERLVITNGVLSGEDFGP